MTESSGSKSRPYDVLVVGGGLAGASLAHALSGSGLSIALIEASPPGDGEQSSYDERTTAISWGSRCLFEGMGLWSGMQGKAAPIRSLHVSQQGSFGTTRVHCEEYGVEALGYVLPNRALGEVLYQPLTGRSDVSVIAPARFEGLVQHEDRVEVHLSLENAGEHIVHGRLLVGADGGRSGVRAAVGIASQVHDYEQKAIVTTITPGRLHDDQAFERFCAAGPLALLPRSPVSCAVVWALPTGQAERLLSASDTEFLDALQSAFGWRLGRLSEPGQRQDYPLLRLLSEKPVSGRAVLVGNSAHNLHPAAAQGFNLTLRDVVLLASLLKQRRGAHGAAFDPGDSETLRIWSEARAADQQRVSGFTDGIVKLFSNRIPGLVQARALGLTALDCLPEIKQGMARRSMGLAMDWDSLSAPRASASKQSPEASR